jgi:far upstream element-binding protein
VIEIESSLVGLVIGRQGENLRRIETDSGTRIQFITPPSHGGPQRECRITGNPRARMDAKREIYRIIDENGGSAPREHNRGAANNRQSTKPPPQQQQQQQQLQQQQSPQQPALREGEDQMQIMVPDRTVGLIIGRGGETIRDLQERSGCHINIVGANKSVNGLRPVNLIGSQQAANRAKDLILEIVESDTRGPGATNDQQPASISQSHTGGYQSGGGGSGAGTTGGSDKINETIMVPSDSVGMIIGKGKLVVSASVLGLD